MSSLFFSLIGPLQILYQAADMRGSPTAADSETDKTFSRTWSAAFSTVSVILFRLSSGFRLSGSGESLFLNKQEKETKRTETEKHISVGQTPSAAGSSVQRSQPGRKSGRLVELGHFQLS
ncbi:hypothetical protein AMECASPLE_030779 [Ameca splendens]|uniref:Uncharacterized protein n=1 Tax=Ameca splendens TaxID=208324 RepID=A0ABV0XVM4_9TELE